MNQLCGVTTVQREKTPVGQADPLGAREEPSGGFCVWLLSPGVTFLRLTISPCALVVSLSPSQRLCGNAVSHLPTTVHTWTLPSLGLAWEMLPDTLMVESCAYIPLGMKPQASVFSQTNKPSICFFKLAAPF